REHETTQLGVVAEIFGRHDTELANRLAEHLVGLTVDGLEHVESRQPLCLDLDLDLLRAGTASLRVIPPHSGRIVVPVKPIRRSPLSPDACGSADERTRVALT